MAELDGAHPIGATVAAMMTKAVITTSQDTTVVEADRLLHPNHITGTAAVAALQGVVGLVS